MLGSDLITLDKKICNALGLEYDKYTALDCSGKFQVGKDYLNLLKLTNKALSMVASSPSQLEVIKKVNRIRNKYKTLEK
jgi:hypothetical protein